MLGRIAVHLDAEADCQRRIDAAVKIAAAHKAELVGIYTSDNVPQLGYTGFNVPQNVLDMLRKQIIELEEKVQSSFMDQTRAAGIEAHWRSPGGPADETLALHARYCRLLIMSKAENRQRTASPVNVNLPESVIMAAGRPVLMVPATGLFETVGERILFCWDQRREAARAFTDAAPLLRACKELIVLGIDEDTSALRDQDIRENDFRDLCVALGFPAPKTVLRSSEEVGVGNVILNTAADYGNDLIVMGAYGHSRMKQWIMGGASKTLLSSMTVPVLLSH